ncbi:MAG: hypothetical protein E7473_06190 [Ruminococcaceae bacterium]|nr:hypothetical protein [Oscillospiraceae bacterium]
MSLDNYKITTYEDNVKELPDYPSDAGYTAKELKAIFDGRSDKEIKEKFNALIDELKTNLGKIEIELSLRIKEDDMNLRNGEGEDSIVQHTSVEDKEGAQSTATGTGAFATGRWNRADADCSVAMNYNNEVSGTWAFACGYGNDVSGDGGFASGAKNSASEVAATATGSDCIASGRYSFAGGHFSEAKHESSFVAGHLLKSTNAYTAAFGKFNDYSNGKNIFVVGFGKDENSRENVLTVNRDGIVIIRPSYIAPEGSEATLQLGTTKLTESELIEVLGLGEVLRETSEKAETNFAEINVLYGLLTDKADKSDVYTKAETMTEMEVYVGNELDVLYRELNSHTAREDNPHKVTAEQLGVYTKEEIDAMYGDISAALDAILAHQQYYISGENI